MALPSHIALPRKKINALIRGAQRGDVESRNFLITNNLRFVMRLIIKTTGGQVRRRNFETQNELMQVAIVGTNGRGGLVRAIELFDPDRGHAFSTFAGPWVIREIRDYMNAHHMVYPSKVQQQILSVRRVAGELNTKDPETILAYTDAHGPKVTRALVDLAMIPSHTYGVQDDVAVERDPALSIRPRVDAEIQAEQLKDRVGDAIDRALTDREAFVIRAAHGIGDRHHESKSFVDIGEALGMTRNAAATIYNRASEKLASKLEHLQGEIG